jgi:hypothetical protein
MQIPLSHAVIAALVALALAATPALARPIDPPDRVVTEGPTAAAKAIPRAAKPIPPSKDTDSEPWLVLGVAHGTAGLAGAGAAVATRHTRVRATA